MLDNQHQSRAGERIFPWRSARRIIQALSLGGFLVSFAQIGRQGRMGGGSAAWVGKLPIQLDPLAALAHSTAGRVLLTGSLFALGTVLVTLVFGRVFCGWLCPLGTVLDWLPFRRIQRKLAVPARWRSIKFVLLGVIFLGAVFSSLTLVVFDPLTLVYRTLAGAVWPALDQAVTAAERVLFRVPFLQGPVAAFDGFARSHFLPSTPVVGRSGWLFAGLFLGVAVLDAAAPRFWCRYLCPLGGLLGLIGKAAVIKARINSRCTDCGRCGAVCPTGAISGRARDGVAHSECTMCMNCPEACSRRAVEFTPALSLSPPQSFDPGRREVLISAGTVLAGVGLSRLPLLRAEGHPHRILPPGSAEDEFLSSCLRCGACLTACPTGGLQHSLVESGWEGLWAPVLVPRLGQCDYSCRACGQACPVGAIPFLTLQTKREQVIGKAFLNRERCIAWADEEDCIVCEEMCPVPDKAITLQGKGGEADGDGQFTVQQPIIDRDLCIGCGICEHQCPVEGEAAVRVFSTGWIPDSRYW